MIELGSPFPEFSLPDQDGTVRSLTDFQGSPALFYFYPKDDTSGCTAQACALRDSFPRFQGVHVVGVSPDSSQSHRRFIDKHKLPFTLLADEKEELCEACGVWVEKSMYGKKYMGIRRGHAIISPEGTIEDIRLNISPDESVAKAVEFLAQ